MDNMIFLRHKGGAMNKTGSKMGHLIFRQLTGGGTMNRIFCGFLAFFLIFSGNALASTCYTQAEAEAEQGLRIHSELMVIGLNCQNMRFRDGTNLYLEYRDFTQANVDIFAGYENRLMDYFRRRGDNDPEASLNTMRTFMANKISNSAARMKPDQFCNRYAGRIFKASSMDRSSLKQWASTIYPSHPVSQPICQ